MSVFSGRPRVEQNINDKSTFIRQDGTTIAGVGIKSKMGEDFTVNNIYGQNELKRLMGTPTLHNYGWYTANKIASVANLTKVVRATANGAQYAYGGIASNDSDEWNALSSANIDIAGQQAVNIFNKNPDTTVATAGTITGTVIVGATVDLATNKNVDVTIDETSTGDIDVSGGTPAATTLVEILAILNTNINTALGTTGVVYATNDGSESIVLTSANTGLYSVATIADGSANGCLSTIFGATATDTGTNGSLQDIPAYLADIGTASDEDTYFHLYGLGSGIAYEDFTVIFCQETTDYTDGVNTFVNSRADYTITGTECYMSVYLGTDYSNPIEKYLVSLDEDALDPINTTNSIYIVNVVNNKSEFLYCTANTSILSSTVQFYEYGVETGIKVLLHGGNDNGDSGTGVALAEVVNAYGIFADTNIDLDIVSGCGWDTSADVTVNTKINTVAGLRKWFRFYISVPKATAAGTDSETYRNTTLNLNTYWGSLIWGWTKIWDNYNGNYSYLPPDAHKSYCKIKALKNGAEDFTPIAGDPDGIIDGVVAMELEVNDPGYYDTMFDASINYIRSIPGSGYQIEGTRTLYSLNSALSDDNAIDLILSMMKSIKPYAELYKYRFNDAITQADFKGDVEDLCENLAGRRAFNQKDDAGFYIVTDETVNTDLVVNNNQFICQIYIKPNKVIYFIEITYIPKEVGSTFNIVG